MKTTIARRLLALGLLALPPMLGNARAAAAPAPQKVVVSTDAGDDIDDAFALGLLLRSPELQVQGIASAWGDTALRVRLLQRLLAAAGTPDIPLALGEPTRSAIPFSQARWRSEER
ncbi:MAG TPA: nucleoside hydrolase, partial [Xanthomonadaceae bacterium]|nr:nucleoside hydrolase [Xanthomonadaceae bacterium]